MDHPPARPFWHGPVGCLIFILILSFGLGWLIAG
jgi:hypothetical protein